MEEFINLAGEFGPIIAITIYVIIKGVSYAGEAYRDRQEFNQEITRDSLSGKYNDNDEDRLNILVEMAKIGAKLEYQSKKMKSIEKQTTNHVSEIQADIKTMKDKREKLGKDIASMEKSLEYISKKIEKIC